MSLLIAIIGLGLLIFVHEAGHFLTALVVGMRPRSFNIGFGPPLAKTTRKGIVYAIRGIPLGGYVKIPGMHRPAPSDVDVHFATAIREAPELTGPAERMKRLLKAGEIEGAHAALETLRGEVKAAKLSPEGRRAADRGLTELGDGIGSDAYWRQTTWRRIAVIIAGPGANVICSLFLFWIFFMAGNGVVTRTVDYVDPTKDAARIELMRGDEILNVTLTRPTREQLAAFARNPVPAETIPGLVRASKGRNIWLSVRRKSELHRLGPGVAAQEKEKGKPKGPYLLGFGLRGTGLPVGDAAWRSVKVTGIVSKEIVLSLGRLVHKEQRDEISSPVGIVDQSSDTLRQGVAPYLGVLGLISLSLALLNLLPLLPLDGGHIAFSLIEGVRGRAVPRAVYERVSAVGIALVLLLFFVGLSNDIGRIGG